MFNLRQGSIATDRDGVQENLDNNIFAVYFSPAERIGREKNYF